MRKKSQATGGAAAALIGIITLILVFYIVLIPPEDRARLLGEGTEYTEEGALAEYVLLDAAIGSLDYVPETTVPHMIPNIVLQEVRNAVVLEEINPFIISKGIVGQDDKVFSFKLLDSEHTENVLLTFKTPVHEGILQIVFNGFEIFESDLTTSTPEPVKIRDDYLQPTNTIVFSVDGFGFPTKEYSFENVRIVGEVIDANRLRAIETLPLREFEFRNIDNSVLEYYAVCNQFSIGNLDISINGNKIFTGVPSCDSVNRQDIYKADLREGKNEIEFKIKKGGLRLELMKLKNYLKPSSRFTDFYTVDNELYEQVKAGEKKIILQIDFLDDGTAKKAKTNVNSEFDIIEQKDAIFRRDVSSVVVKGSNFLEITPLKDLYITKVQVRIE